MLKDKCLHYIGSSNLLLIAYILIFTGCQLGGTIHHEQDNSISFGGQSQVAPVLTASVVNAKPLRRSMKGYELYSWTDGEGGKWRYTLITGTDRLKTIEEITAAENQETQSEWAKITVTGIDELNTLLRRLPPATDLTWSNEGLLEIEPGAVTNLRLPESGQIEALKEYCSLLNIHLHVDN